MYNDQEVLIEDLDYHFSNILRDLATIEADVASHCEAVLNQRLSKINREKMLHEQRCLVMTSSSGTGSCGVAKAPSNDPIKKELSTICSTYDLTAPEDLVGLANGGQLVHAKSTGNLLAGGMRRLKQALR